MSTPATPHALGWARDVAAHLDTADRPRWRARAEPIGAGRDAHLEGPDGETLSVHTTTAPARMVITWWLPSELPLPVRDQPRWHEITLSPAKTPARAAADITRRMLPTVRDALAAGRERKAHADAATARRLTQLDQLAAILNPASPTTRGSGPGTARVNPGRIDPGPDRERVRFGRFEVNPWGDFRVLGGGEVDLQARLDPAQALAVAELLASLARPSADTDPTLGGAR